MLRLERIRDDIVALGHRAVLNQQQQQETLELAQRWLVEAPEVSALREFLQSLISRADRWNGAVPVSQEPLTCQHQCPGISLDDLVAIGVDGSQIYPDRHALVLYYLLQVGALTFRYNANAPSTHAREWLSYEDSELYDAHGYLIDSETLSMERMVKEMAFLAELVASEHQRAPGPIMGLSDGPLLWPYLDTGADRKLSDYLEALAQVQQSGGVPVGYIDRPGGRPILDLLWAGQLMTDESTTKTADNPAASLTDEVLMRRVLAPGARTSWYTRPTLTNQRHASAGQEVWFCYMNLGSIGSAAIARIEVPAWAAGNSRSMDLLHTALRHQAQVLNGYPYVLARAHEEALVTTQDKIALEQAIQRRLVQLGVLALPSDKATQKALLGQR